MSTQLRLLGTPPARPAATRTTRGVRATAGRARRDRPVAHWQEQWRLDARTRRIGRAGVASAREALARGTTDPGPHPDTPHGALREAS
ncbi:MAG: hypothetical protein AMXMBFR46_25470 [Acidimicrobiia bacterium]